LFLLCSVYYPAARGSVLYFCFVLFSFFHLQTQYKEQDDSTTTTHDRPDDEAEEPIKHSYDGTTNRSHRTKTPWHQDGQTPAKKSTGKNPRTNQSLVMPRQSYHKRHNRNQSGSNKPEIVTEQLPEEDGGAVQSRTHKPFVVPPQPHVELNKATATGKDRFFVRPHESETEFAHTVRPANAALQPPSAGPTKLNQRPTHAATDKIEQALEQPIQESISVRGWLLFFFFDRNRRRRTGGGSRGSGRTRTVRHTVTA